jgi:hypothetical protein
MARFRATIKIRLRGSDPVGREEFWREFENRLDADHAVRAFSEGRRLVSYLKLEKRLMKPLSMRAYSKIYLCHI